MPVTSALGHLRQEDHEFKALVGYRVTLCQAKKGWGGDAVGEHLSRIQNVRGSIPGTENSKSSKYPILVLCFVF